MEYLLFLQNLRENSMSWLTPLLSFVSEATITVGPMIAAIIYMCVDKKWGSKLLFNLCSGDFIMNNIKITACVYRPWIKEPKIHVAEEVADTATGYSFPSGHSTTATTVYGTIAIWQKAKKWLLTIMIILIALTLFARNWLGAHTLQDVLVALLVGAAAIAITHYGDKWLEKDNKRDIWILLSVLLLCLLSVLYVSFKSYPLDYLEDGSLLVDPAEMAKDAWAAVGMLAAWVISWFVERRFIKFEIDGSPAKRIVRGFIIALVFFVGYKVIFKKLSLLVGGAPGAFLRRFLTVLLVCIVIPWAISFLQKRRNK